MCQSLYRVSPEKAEGREKNFPCTQDFGGLTDVPSKLPSGALKLTQELSPDFI